MKNRRERRRIIKRLISGVSALALSVGLLASIPASADDSTVGYKYTLFAYSSEEGAITSSAANFCVNGNIATNGTISAGQNFNVNGEKKEHVKEAMPDLTKAINEKFFAENVDVKAENYKNEDVNINVASPLDVKGKAELKGNIKLAAAVKAMGDIVLSGGVLNNDNTVLFSENGSIYINSENVSLTGLVYAPRGNIVIDSKCLNLNSVVIIANKITLNSPNININSNTEMAKFVQESIDKNGGSNGNEEPETDKDPVIYAYGEYNEETKSVDIEWYSNVTGEFAVLESMNGTDYTVVSKISDDTKYSYKVTSDFIKKHFKVATIKGNETFESIPFSIVNANGKYSTELLDTDKDGLADLYEEMLGTDKTVHDTDKDGLTDYEEVYITNTDPTKYDSVTEGVSDADADNDKDGLTNKREIELKTDPNSDDTDGDNLKDGDEITEYKTDPLKRDTDGDDLEDDDEFKFNCDPNKKDTDNNGIIDGKEKHQQTLDVVPDNKEQPITKVNISMAASGNIEKTTTVESIMGKDVLCSNVVGLVGEPFSIESKSSFDKATITFTVDKTKLGETEFDNLMFLWYDEDNDRFVELETYHDVDSSTVSTTTTHFSKYMIVDSYAWFKNWRTILSEQNKKYIENFKPCVTAICVDCSGSMSYNDPVYDTTNKTKRYDAINSFQQAMLWKDYVSIITYESKTKEVSYFSDYFHLISSEELKKSIYSSGGTYVGPALNKAMSQFDSFNQTNPDMDIEKYILLLSDGEFSLQDSILDDVKNKGIVINAVALGKYADKNMLKYCADKTGGEFYEAMTSDDLTDIYRKISKFTHKTSTSNTVSFEDKDIDGVPDEFEKTGFVLSNGTVITTDPTKPDTDGDGLTDGQEIDPIPCIFNFNPKSLSDLLKPKTGSFDLNSSHQDTDISGYYFNMRSDPTKQDSDGDLDNDNIDPRPNNHQLNDCFISKLQELQGLAKEYNDDFEKKYEAIQRINKTKYSLSKEYWYVFMFIRQFNDKYISGNWPIAGGAVENEFVEYVKNKNESLYDYFEEAKSIYAKCNKKEVVDLRHMAATLTVYLYKTDWCDTFPNPKGMMFEKHIDNLGGWAGDLQQLMKDINDNYVNAYNNSKEYYRMFCQMLGEKGAFDQDDLYSDVDAHNIYMLLQVSPLIYDTSDLATVFSRYYNLVSKLRFNIFMNGENIRPVEDTAFIYTSAKYTFFSWPIFKNDEYGVENFEPDSFTSKKISKKFAEFIEEKASNEQKEIHNNTNSSNSSYNDILSLLMARL